MSGPVGISIGAEFTEQIRDPLVGEETDQLAASVQRIALWGVWHPVTYASALFWPNQGTWTPKAADVRLFQWCIVGRKMTVQFHIQNGAATGVVNILYLRVPNTGYTIVPIPTTQAVPTLFNTGLMASGPCGIWQNTNAYSPGTIGVLNARTDSPVLACCLNDLSQINTVANAGCYGQIDFAVQPAA